MNALINSNVLLRHLTAQPPDQARRATRFLGQDHELTLTDVILAEVVYVLESFYRRPRPKIAATAGARLALPSVATADQALPLRALERYGTLRRDFAEMYLAATAERLGIGRVVSFHRDLGCRPDGGADRTVTRSPSAGPPVDEGPAGLARAVSPAIRRSCRILARLPDTHSDIGQDEDAGFRGAGPCP